MLLRMLKLSVGKGCQVMKQLCLRYYVRATVAIERAGYVLYRAFNVYNQYSYLKDLIPEINQCVGKFLNNLESSALAKTPVSLRDEFSLLTLNVISKVSGK